MAKIIVLPYCPIHSYKKSGILRRKKMKNPHKKTAYCPAFLTYCPVKSGKQGNRGILRAPLGSTPKGGARVPPPISGCGGPFARFRRCLLTTKISRTRCQFAHQPAPLNFFHKKFFSAFKQNSPAGLQKFSWKNFPDTRPQFQNDFKTFRYEKIPAQYFKKISRTGLKENPAPVIPSLPATPSKSQSG
jgi:hypothetical protein